MPDDINISDGLGGTAIVSTDLLDDGSHAQEVKILQSAATDGSRWTIDGDGALVNLGTNRDVVLDGGTLTAIAGTVTTSVAGTPTVAATFSGGLAAGTNRIGYVGISSDGTAIADLLSLTSGTAVAVGIYDGSGDQLTFPSPITVGGTVTNGTAVYAAGDTMGTVVALAGFQTYGDIKGARLFDPSDQGQSIDAWVFRATVTPSADNAAFALSDGDLVNAIGVIQFDDYFDATNGQMSIGKLTPVGHPQAYTTTAGTAFVVLQSQGTGTYATASVSFELDVQPIE